MTYWQIARESAEYVGPITVTNNGVPVTSFEVAVSLRGTRPTAWSAPDVAGTARYVLVGPGTTRPLGVGIYVIWGRYTALPETPVFTIGTLTIT